MVLVGSGVHQPSVAAAQVVNLHARFELRGFEHAPHLLHFGGHKRRSPQHGIHGGSQNQDENEELNFGDEVDGHCGVEFSELRYSKNPPCPTSF
jgi:hypothetical protein